MGLAAPFDRAAMAMPPEAAAAIWNETTAELNKDMMKQQKEQARKAMEGDTSQDHVESKAIIAKVCYAIWKSAPAGSPMKQGCADMELPAFIQVASLIPSRLPLCAHRLLMDSRCTRLWHPTSSKSLPLKRAKARTRRWVCRHPTRQVGR